MLPRVTAIEPRGALRVLTLVLGVGGLLGACGGDDEATEGEPMIEPAEPVDPVAASAATTARAAVDWSERLAEPTVPDLLTALAQPHAVVRKRVGPHMLTATTDVSLAPVGEPATVHPPLDAPVVAPQAVHDELELRWATPPDPSAALLALTQSNDHERGRDVVVVAETMHVRQAHRPWVHYPRDSDVIELWLDDAQRSVHDAVQLAAPRLSLQAARVDGAGLEGGPAVEITLALADATDPGLVAPGPTRGWRAGAEIQAVEGTVLLDAGSGAWLSAAIDVAYGIAGADGRPLRGSLAPGSPGAIEAPVDSIPLPQRLRYDEEQRRLLDGLAAP
jgi:hypothetical protein